MSKLSSVEAMLTGADGVTVIKAGDGYQVAFSFSNNLVNKMKTVPDAKFDKEEGVWSVPKTSGNQLVGAVADMRDFVSNNGVQVKDVEGGGKQVLFDYNPELGRIIGAVEGAEFDKATRVWNVPATVQKYAESEKKKVPVANPALAVPAVNPDFPDVVGVSGLDYAINKMRGLVIEVTRDSESILNGAVAALGGEKAAPVFPVAGKAYSGKMVHVNGHFAAQEIGTNEVFDKETKASLGFGKMIDGVFEPAADGKVTFVVIHDLNKIGDVFQGDDLRVDYDDKLNASVRTVAVFKQQQADREYLTKIAGGLHGSAKVVNAAMKDGTQVSGTVKDLLGTMALVHSGRGNFTLLPLDGKFEVKKDQDLDVIIKGGKLIDNSKQQESRVNER